ncbi:MAG TPA: ferritin-like protein [Solirubrobacteraceae bacterium]|nr:ferritin-like protein [Solirubrobacteraceae bacterium]
MTVQTQHPVDAQKPIETVQELHNHLHQAAAVELSTIPLYLYAAYSIKTSSYSQWDPGISAFRAIRSVVIEEMLHLCLARNVLVATGGGDQIRFYDEHFVPTYPSPMLHRVPDLMLQLEPCTPQLMQDVFMPLELPAVADAPSQPDTYNTLGQFYAAIVDGLERLSGPDLWREPHADLQYDEAYWNQDGGGAPIVVTDLPSALAAIKTIVEQGEGAAPGDEEVPLKPATPQLGLEELSHYAKFSRIAQGIDGIGEVWPVPTNPRRGDFHGPVGALAELFDAAYCYVLCLIDAIYEASTRSRTPGDHSARYGLERTFIAAMGGLLYPLADLLVRQPGAAPATNAAPTFGFYRFDPDRPKKEQLVEKCDAVLAAFPSLGGDDGVRRLIGRLPSV